ncbi:hypothetical protein [Bacillus suaedaesalsae]|uniref:DUF4025 domain-containing protein n=1 Tax=Bacillus suaedaesalsae TaxID=2810349 RepID=A0ABS2DFB4_9BACI|nr:hypothetical protein [Bacillus suaedaesalsae]MBM6617162.1 hypothetical protein [Bacillus suaedaesalsae]
MSEQNVNEPKKNEIPFSTPLNPQMTVTSGFNHFSGSNLGDSVDEHISVEEGNEYIAEKEISQVFNNS